MAHEIHWKSELGLEKQGVPLTRILANCRGKWSVKKTRRNGGGVLEYSFKVALNPVGPLLHLCRPDEDWAVPEQGVAQRFGNEKDSIEHPSGVVVKVCVIVVQWEFQ